MTKGIRTSSKGDNRCILTRRSQTKQTILTNDKDHTVRYNAEGTDEMIARSEDKKAS